jgi:hypothetical protein
MREKIHQLLIELRLKGMQEVLEPELTAAEKKGKPPQKFFTDCFAKNRLTDRNAACTTG